MERGDLLTSLERVVQQHHNSEFHQSLLEGWTFPVEDFRRGDPDTRLVWALPRLKLFMLVNHSLEWLEIRGTWFCVGQEGELFSGLVFVRAIYVHPSLRAMYLEPSHLPVARGVLVTVWSYT